MKEFGEPFKIAPYIAISTILEGMKALKGRDERLRKKFDYPMSTIQMSQERI